MILVPVCTEPERVRSFPRIEYRCSRPTPDTAHNLQRLPRLIDFLIGLKQEQILELLTTLGARGGTVIR